MAKAKWWKWAVGIGSVSSLAIFLNAVQGADVPKGEEQDYSASEIKSLDSQEKEAREEWISTLDWEDANWDVDASAHSATFTPKGEGGRAQADQRTRRS
ncbi:hypothetical protein [Bacillus sp. FJAT-42315]|uniref:hypothetical protein n=1 Tax=Bacillus sp. FJAT-42315 TaxID=2014077 RepID=UPI000C239DB5|nr:hypothetical protein [Bacillus sp. FJAT-42315]